MRSRALLLIPLCVLMMGAKKAKTTTDTTSTTSALASTGTAQILSSKPTSDGLTEEQVDLNSDGKAEVTNYYREREGATRLLVRKETDLNRDGKIDVRTTFDDAGLRVQEEMDGDFDGRADWVDHYISGNRSYSEIDTDWNGTFDLFKYYESGKVRRKERDTNADGRVDFWEYLDDKGVVVKTGKDNDGDGKMDVRDQ
jgi:hypothetical protein